MRRIQLYYQGTPDVLTSLSGIQEPWPAALQAEEELLGLTTRDTHVVTREWNAPKTVPNTNLSGTPSAVVLGPFIYVFHTGRGRSTSLWYNRTNGIQWKGDVRLSGIGITGSPSAVVYGDKIHVFYQGENRSGTLYRSIFQVKGGLTWTSPTGELEQVGSEERIDNVGISHSPGAVVYLNDIWVFHHGSNNCNELWYTVSDSGTSTWSTDRQCAGASIAGSPTPVVYDSSLYIYYLADTASPDPMKFECVDYFAKSWTGVATVSNITPTVATAPAVVAKDGDLYLFYLGGTQNTALQCCTLSETGNPSNSVIASGVMATPGIVLFPAP